MHGFPAHHNKTMLIHIATILSADKTYTGRSLSLIHILSPSIMSSSFFTLLPNEWRAKRDQSPPGLAPSFYLLFFPMQRAPGTQMCIRDRGYYIETPKTKSGIRQVPLSRETIQAFQRVMKKHPKAEPFVIDGRSNFLFVNHKGKPKVAIDYNALFVRMVKKYNKHHKDNPLPHITPHTLRHTFCTRLASKNMNPKDLQYIMGHSNISITMNWYAHASIDTAKSEVQRLIA